MFGSTSLRRGSAMLEFVLAGVPLLFIIISLCWMCLGMWQYHTVAEAVSSTARSASVHGAGCAGQTCATTVASTAQMLAAKAVGIPPSRLNVTLASSASTVSCAPLTSCYSNSSAWPSLSGNGALTTEVRIDATYQFSSGLAVGLPVSGANFGAVTLGASSTDPVEY